MSKATESARGVVYPATKADPGTCGITRATVSARGVVYPSSRADPIVEAAHSRCVQPAPPEEPALWRETFEAAGLDNAWDPGIVANIGAGTPPTLDPDAEPPAGAPGSWGDECLRISWVGGGTGAVNGHVRHNAIEVPPSKNYELELSFIVEAESAANGQNYGLFSGAFLDGVTERFPFSFTLRQGNGVNGLANGVFGIGGTIRSTGSGAGTQTNLTALPVELGTPYTIRLVWSIETLTWAAYLDEELMGNGVIADEPASEEWVPERVIVGLRANDATIGGITFAVDNLVITGD